MVFFQKMHDIAGIILIYISLLHQQENEAS